jgi:imidazoleglycerol phosphate synthase glutamine amidotransferase subunit HisH
MIAPVHYGLGNLKSIRDMLGRADIEGVISIEPDEPSKLILPGIRHFRFRMRPVRVGFGGSAE